jgi:hypothetical protein
MKLVRVSKTGAFTLTGIAEGDYWVAAMRDDAAGDWPDPKFLAALRSSATRVTMADGDRKTVHLRTIR